MNFIEKLTQMTMRSVNICGFLTSLLMNIRKDCETEFIYPKLTDCLKLITDKFSSYYFANFKISEDHMRLYCAALCLSGKEGFLERFDEAIGIIIQRIREKSFSNEALLMLNELLQTYYNRYPDAWATILDRTESIFIQIFPQGRKQVLGCDDVEGVSRIVNILETVTRKLPRFCYNEIIKKLVRQCGNSTHDNFPWDRANITLQTFLFLASINHSNSNSDNTFNNQWQEEYSKVRIGDLELEPMSKEVSELIKLTFSRILKQYWMPHLNAFVFDLNKTKLLAFIKMVLEKYGGVMDFGLVLRLTEANVEVIEESALTVLKARLALDNTTGNNIDSNSTHVLVHKIGNMIFGQSFKIIDENVLLCAESEKVFDFFRESFDRNYKLVPIPPVNLQENPVLRGGVFHILESLTSWSQTRLVESTRLSSKEIELFGKVVDVYFRLLTKYEALVKTVYLEKQSDKNIILRSWSSLVGFKRNSKEISDFLVSILGYSDEKLRCRMIQSLSLLPQSRSNEFMKLLEKFRLAVSEDFVNLKRSRRNDNSKTEITRVYANILVSWQLHEVSNLTPLRMILRHVIELYYYVSKNEVLDEFIWKLRGEFCGLLREYLKILNSMSAGTRKSFLPQKFYLEVWLTVDEWCQVPQTVLVDGYLEVIEGLFSNFSFNLLSAVSEVDNSSLPTFIDNLLIKISRISSEVTKTVYVYNLLKSSMNEAEIVGLLFIKLIEFIGSGRDFGFGIQEGIQQVLDEESDSREKDDSDCETETVDDSVKRILSKPKLKGPALELFRLMRKDSEDHSVTISDPQGVLEMFNLVSDAKFQRRILNKLRLNPCPLDEKIIRSLLELSGKLVETFPNSLRDLWQSLIKTEVEDKVSIILHFLIEKLQRDDDIDTCEFAVVEFVYMSLVEVKKEAVDELICRYSHPFSGTRTLYKRSPLEAVLRLTGNCEASSLSVVRSLISEGDLEHKLNKSELLKWATGCPIKAISLAAWMNLKRQSQTFTDEFVCEMITNTRRFFQHLVCPTTFKYFDADFVKDILGVFKDITSHVEGEETIKVIYEFALVQLSATDDIVYEAACKLINVCLERGSLQEQFKLDELLRRPSLSIDLLFSALIANGSDYKYTIEEYFGYLVAFLPFLFRFFEEFLNVNTKDVVLSLNCAEIEYLRLLIKVNQKVIIEAGEVDEMAALCLVELNEFLISVEKQKRRPSIDFYKNLASLLAEPSINKLTQRIIMRNLDFTAEYEEFLVYFLDCVRIQKGQVDVSDRFRIAEVLAEPEAGDVCVMRQRVIDFLIN